MMSNSLDGLCLGMKGKKKRSVQATSYFPPKLWVIKSSWNKSLFKRKRKLNGQDKKNIPECAHLGQGYYSEPHLTT